MRMTADLIDDLVTDFNPFSTIKLVDVKKIFVCNTLHIREGSIITINGDNYTVISANPKTGEINLKEDTDDIEIGDFMYGTAPFFFHGTPQATGNDLIKYAQSETQFPVPMIYLFEVLSDKMNYNEEDAIDRESVVDLFFLDEANFRDWDTDQHYSEAINPMSNYADLFVKYLKQAQGIGVILDAEMTYHAKFGLSTKLESGHLKNLFPENLSGTRLRIKIPFLKSLTCDC